MKKIDEEVLKKMIKNLLKAIFIIFYFFIINIAHIIVEPELLTRAIQLLTLVFLFIGIALIEKSYKKDDGKIAIEGIEVLVLAAHLLTIEHVTTKFKFYYEAYILSSSYIFALYFVLKTLIIYTNWIKECDDKRSDIKEILKKEEPIKKEATKKKKENTQKKTEQEEMEIKEKTIKDDNTNKKTKTNVIAKNKEKTKKEIDKNNKKQTKKQSNSNKKEVKKDD